MIRTLIYLMLFMSCCGSELDGRWLVPPNNPKFDRYRVFFEHHTGYRGTYQIPIAYGKEDALASCRYANLGEVWLDRHIVVNRELFDPLPLNWRRAIIAHELIHCLLRRGHERPRPGRFTLMAAELPVHIPLSDAELLRELRRWRKR